MTEPTDTPSLFDAAPPAPEAVLRGLDDAQRAAVTSEAGRLLVVAGPGSGKTRVLTRRVAEVVRRGTPADHVVVITFTRRAAGELERRLRRLGVEGVRVGTFHALALAELRRRARDSGRRAPRVVEDRHAVVVRTVSRWGWTVGAGREIPHAGALDEAVDEIGWALVHGFDGAGYAASAVEHGRDPQLGIERMAELLDGYAAAVARRGAVDLDGLVGAWAAALRDDPTYGPAARWRTDHVLVDEGQDLSPTQLAAVRELTRSCDLTVVGDARQAIYGFQGAAPDVLDRLRTGEDRTEVVELTTSYRCPAPVLAAATEVLGDRSGAPLRSAVEAGHVDRRRFDRVRDEQAALAALVAEERGAGRRHGEVAVLARTNALADEVAAGLRSHGVPVDGADGDGVTVTTFHAAKGLEWPVVVLVGCEEGVVPHPRAEDADEERRLLFVAMTRAARRLVVTSTVRRAGDVADRPVSPFLAGTAASGGVDEPAPGLHETPLPPWQVELQRCRQELRRDDAGARRRRLEAWRTRTARRARLRQEAVLSDALVRDLARRPPADVEELGDRCGWGPETRSRLAAGLLAVT